MEGKMGKQGEQGEQGEQEFTHSSRESMRGSQMVLHLV
jgi:hypothetical protein